MNRITTNPPNYGENDFKLVSSLGDGSTTTTTAKLDPRITNGNETHKTSLPSAISSSNTQVLSSESLREHRDSYIQQVHQTKEHLLSVFEKQKMLLQSADNTDLEKTDLLEKLEYLMSVLGIKTQTYIGKFNNTVLYNSNSKLNNIFRKFQKEMSKISEMGSNREKLKAIILGETFYEPPSDIRLYDIEQLLSNNPNNTMLQQKYKEMLEAYLVEHPDLPS